VTIELEQLMSPFMRLLVKAVRSIRAAGLPRDPKGKPPHDWESFGRDLGRAVRKLRDEERPRQ